MVKIRKKDVEKNKISYYYMGDGETSEGVVSFYPLEDKFVVEKPSEAKYDAIYAQRASYAIYSFYQKDEFPEAFTVRCG